LTLFGEVNWNLDREAAEQTVRKLSGVTGVTNLLTAKDCAVDEITSFPRRQSREQQRKSKISDLSPPAVECGKPKQASPDRSALRMKRLTKLLVRRASSH
jgi:hypothetical protein